MQNIKLIALDIDGVLNSSSPYERKFKTFDLIPEKIEILNKIIKKTNAKILLTSTWRLDFGPWTGIDMFFEAVGITPVCIGRTERFQGHDRGLEILEWIVRKQIFYETTVTHLCIVDDDNDMNVLMPWLVNTKNKIGLTEKNAKDIIKMLNKPFDFNIKLGINNGK